MTDLYSRLFKYQTTEAKSPLEDFSTEILCNFLNRISSDAIDKFLRKVVFYGMKKEYNTFIKNHKTDDKDLKIDWETQYSININDATKRPDLLGFVNNKPAILIEVKIGAGFTYRMQQSDDGDTNYIYQLEDYGKWLNEKNTKAILVLLSRYTSPPDDFMKGGGKYDILLRNYVTWNHIYQWLKVVHENNQYEPYVKDFIDYLLEQNMANESPTRKDFSALESFIGSNAGKRIKTMMQHIRGELEKKYPSHLNWKKEQSFQKDGYHIVYEENITESWGHLNSDEWAMLLWGICYPNEEDNLYGCRKYCPSLPKVPFVYIAIYTEGDKILEKHKNAPDNIKHKDWCWLDETGINATNILGIRFHNLAEFISYDKDPADEIFNFVDSGFQQIMDSGIIEEIIK